VKLIKAEITIPTLVIVIDVITQFFSLTSAFSYEYALLNALLLWFAVSALVFGYCKNRRKDECGFYSVAAGIPISLIAVVMAPIVISFIFNAGGSCPFFFGLKYFFWISFLAAFYSYLFTLSILKGFFRFRFGIFLFTTFIFIAVPFIEIYSYPQIYSYSVIWGYFPGTMYDELIRISNDLIYYRLILLFLFVVIYLGVSKKLTAKAFLIGFLLYLFFAVYVKPLNNFDTNKTVIKNTSKVEVNSPNFNIYFFYDVSKTDAKYSALEHEYLRDEILGVTGLSGTERVTSYIYKSSKQKAKLFGSAAADVSKPWQSAVFTEKRSSPSTLKHELVHAYSASIGTGLTKLAACFNPALIEGFAAAVQDDYLNRPIDEAAAAVYREGRKVNLQKMFSGFDFFESSPAFGYLFAGAFVKYLIQHFGMDKFSGFYSSGNFQKSYGISFAEAEKSFYNYLQSLKVSEDKELVNYLLGSKSIFRRSCRHYVAEQMNVAESLMNSGKNKKAEVIFENLYLRFQKPQAFFGLVNSLLESGNEKSALKMIEDNFQKFQKSAYKLKFFLLATQVNILTDNFQKARKLLMRLNDDAPFYYYKEVSTLLINLLKTSTNEAKLYLKSNGKNKKKILLSLFSETGKEIFLRTALRYVTEKDLEKVLSNVQPTKLEWRTDFDLSNYFIKRLDFERAKYYSNLIGNNYPAKAAFLVNNLKSKIAWFSENKKLLKKVEIL
jgi:hypothetical protein